MTDFKLKRAVSVGSEGTGPLQVLGAGTLLDQLSDYERDQLSPAHFADDDGNEPDDWRTNEATLEHDRRQVKANVAEEKARLKAKRERDAAAKDGGK